MADVPRQVHFKVEVPVANRVELAKVAYHAYGQVTEFKNFRGEPMPPWDDLGEQIQQAWIAAALAAALAIGAPSVKTADEILKDAGHTPPGGER